MGFVDVVLGIVVIVAFVWLRTALGKKGWLLILGLALARVIFLQS